MTGMLAVSGNWGWIKTGRSRGSRRRRIALTIACIGVGLVLVVLLGQLGIASSPDITGKVLFIVGLPGRRRGPGPSPVVGIVTMAGNADGLARA